MIISISLLAPSPRITKERAEAWEARESRDCMCVSRRLPAFASWSSHHRARGSPHHHRRTSVRIRSFPSFFFCVSRMERRRYLSYPKRHCALSTHPYPHYDITMRLKTHTKPRRLRRALWTRPFRRAGQENVFRSASARDLFAVDTTSLVRLPSVRHPRHSVRVRAPPNSPLPPSLLLARPSVSFPLPYFFFVAFFSCPFHSVFSTMADFFSFPSPQDPPPVRVASESPELISYIFALINSTSQSFFGFPLSLQPAPRPAQAKKYP